MKKHHFPIRQEGLLPLGCSDLIHHLPLGAENSDLLRDPSNPEEIAVYLKRARDYIKQGHFAKGIDMMRTASQGLPDYLIPIYPTYPCEDADK
jgi:hypothetical protein